MMRGSFAKKMLTAVLFIVFVTQISWRFDEPVAIKNHFPVLEKYQGVGGFDFNQDHLIYDSLQLGQMGLSEKAFTYALSGFEALKQEGALENDSILTIVDFDQPSYNKRMYILDLKNYKLLFHTWAAHGRNSGTAMAQRFSNVNQSNRSSLGFYLTDKTYFGGNGFSLKLMGLEKGLNDRAMQRAIVLHGAPYVSQSTIDKLGYLGRSFGCPAVPVELNRPIIETIKEGSVLFIYNSMYHPNLQRALAGIFQAHSMS